MENKDVVFESVPELLDHYGMSMASLSRRFGIPYRTVQNWCDNGANHRVCPGYLIRMMQTILDADK